MRNIRIPQVFTLIHFLPQLSVIRQYIKEKGAKLTT